MASILPNVVVTCTARKTASASRLAQMRFIKSKALPDRIVDWIDRIKRSGGKLTKASSLYCGNSWVPVLRLLESRQVRVWIISAGHGLITPDTDICSYAATFSRKHPDSVVPGTHGSFQASDWWRGLNARARGKKVRGLAEIATLFPDAPLVVAISTDYLAAVEDDLVLARECLRDDDSLIVISSGASKRGPLEKNFLPCDSRMEHVVGRGRSALNVRLLEDLIRDHRQELRASVLREKYNRLLNRLGDAGYPKRRKSSDGQVQKFILREMKSGESVSHSRLLRKYRESGLACEQSRFRRLFQELKRKDP